jgi:hypothetical protein
MGQATATCSFIRKTVALQKQDSQSAKCLPKLSLESKFSIMGLTRIIVLESA